LCQRAGLDPLDTWAAILRDFYVLDNECAAARAGLVNALKVSN
jgi:hypothetical protein